MVKQFLILTLICVTCSSWGQRLNIGINGGWIFSKNTSTIFDSEPFQFLYAAPYSSEAEDQFDYASPFDQVRLARIYGIQNDNSQSFSFGAGLSYQLKNDVRFSFGMNFMQQKDRVYYGFQNIVINISDEQDLTNTSSPDLIDDYITLESWSTTYQLLGNYDIPLKSRCKPFFSAGYLLKIQVGSNYATESETIQGDSFDPDYFNTRVFQDKLFNELSSDGFRHYLNLGLGLRYFGLNASLNWSFSLGNSQNDLYYINQNFLGLSLHYDILSIALFK